MAKNRWRGRWWFWLFAAAWAVLVPLAVINVWASFRDGTQPMSWLAYVIAVLAIAQWVVIARERRKDSRTSDA